MQFIITRSELVRCNEAELKALRTAFALAVARTQCGTPERGLLLADADEIEVALRAHAPQT